MELYSRTSRRTLNSLDDAFSMNTGFPFNTVATMTRLATLTLCSSLFFLSGCGGSEEPSTPPPAGAPKFSTPPRAAGGAPVRKPNKLRQVNRKQEKKPVKVKAPEPKTPRDFVVFDSTTNAQVEAPGEAKSRKMAFVFKPDSSTKANHALLYSPDDLQDNQLSSSRPRTPSSQTDQAVPNLPEGFAIVPGAKIHASGYPEKIRHLRTNSTMVYIPAGVFIRGHDDGPKDSRPAQPAFTSAYYIDQYEVTIEQFERFRREARSAETSFGNPELPLNTGGDPQQPALGINWRDAFNYNRFYNLTLPTEAEWEKAARGPDGFRYPWGEGRPLWHQPRSFGQLTAVGSYPADRSPFGVFDLCGNAREWVHDWYASDAYEKSQTKDGSPVRDDRGPKRAEISAHRVIRGSAESWDLWTRGHADMKDHTPDVGFRCVFRLAP